MFPNFSLGDPKDIPEFGGFYKIRKFYLEGV